LRTLSNIPRRYSGVAGHNQPMKGKVEQMSQTITFSEQIKLSDIAVLIAVINTGSMRAAAQKCGITQPHVSMIIKNMEGYLGQRLLLRSHAGVQPTNAGITLSKYGASALAEIQAGLRDLANQDKNDNGPIKIGIIQLFGGGLPITAIFRFAQTFPRVNLSIVNYDNSSRRSEERRVRTCALPISYQDWNNPVVWGWIANYCYFEI